MKFDFFIAGGKGGAGGQGYGFVNHGGTIGTNSNQLVDVAVNELEPPRLERNSGGGAPAGGFFSREGFLLGLTEIVAELFFGRVKLLAFLETVIAD